MADGQRLGMTSPWRAARLYNRQVSVARANSRRRDNYPWRFGLTGCSATKWKGDIGELVSDHDVGLEPRDMVTAR
jgi:hypothetical protein